jgi:WD40 repeat protein
MIVLETGFYITGGTVPGGAPSYVERKADEDLFEGVRRGEFCYVLTSRQMGKSSLMVRAAARLRETGVTAIVLDLTAIGQNLDAGQWYEGLLNLIGQQLKIEDEVEDFWLDHSRLGPMQRWMRAMREVVLRRALGPVVIFVDEIDAVRSLPFSTDEFFAGIREFYNRRTEDAELERLTFCLLGVATPSDLIRDTRTTPFNIGRRIELNDFSPEEAAPLAQGFGRDEWLGKKLLQRVIYWTGGHPYLTQRLCQAIAGTGQARDAGDVDRLCEQLFFTSRSRERDDNLHFVRDRLLRSEVDLVSLLDLYGRIRKGKLVPDDETNPLIGILRLAGIARLQEGRLVLRNRVYERVFDYNWVAASLPDAERERQRKAYRRGQLRAATIAAVIIALLVGAMWMTRRALNLAETREKSYRQLLYVARINLAQQAWNNNNVERTLELIGRIDDSSEDDLRGFEWRYLWHLCNGELAKFAQSNPIWSVAISPGGRLLATGGNDRVCAIWDLANGQKIESLDAQGNIWSVAFSPDGRMVAAGVEDGRVKIWDVITWRQIASIKAHDGAVRAVAFSPAANMLATGGDDGAIRLWDPARLQEAIKFKTGQDGTPVFALAFSNNGKLLAAGRASGAIAFLDVKQGRELFVINGHEDSVRSIAFSPDGKTLASCGEDKSVKLWNVATRKQEAVFSQHSEAVWSVAFSPDGEILASGGRDKAIRLWDVGKKQAAGTFKGHFDLITAVAFSPDGKTLVSSSQDKTAKLWDLIAEEEKSYSQDGAIIDLAFSPDDNLLALARGDGQVTLWNRPNRQSALFMAHSMAVTSIAFSPDGKSVATSSEDETVGIWDANSQRAIARLQGANGEIHSIAFSPDGKFLAAAGGGAEIKLWETASWREVNTLKGHDEAVWDVAFSPDGGSLASGGGDGVVNLWSVETGQKIKTFKSRGGRIRSIAFSPDGKTVAAGSEDATVGLYDVAKESAREPLKGHTKGVLSLSFSPDGKTIATASEDQTIRFWNVARSQELILVRASEAPVNSVAFSHSGKLMATGSGNGLVKLWLADAAR